MLELGVIYLTFLTFALIYLLAILKQQHRGLKKQENTFIVS